MNEELEHRNGLPKNFQLNEYRIESVLGKPGGFGITYLATDTNLDLYVAIKEYLPSDFATREGVSTVYVKSSSDLESFDWGLKCFTDEARVLARFSHPNIVRVLRFFQANKTAYMVMEYHEGECLTERLKRGTIPEEELLSIVLPLLDGLEKIHNFGFLHRDIKPNNIYLRTDGTAVLLDFGSARYAVGQISRSVTSIVSPGYAPLEQYDSSMEEQGPWTDIYALGAVMYFAISGEVPPSATRRVMKDPMLPAVVVGKGRYNRNLLSAIDWALEPNGDRRPRSVAKWRERLATGLPLSMQIANSHIQTTGITRPSPLMRRLCPLIMAAGVVLLLMFMGSVVSNLEQKRELNAYITTLKNSLADSTQQLEHRDNIILEIQKEIVTTERENVRSSRIIEHLRHFETDIVNKISDYVGQRDKLELPLYVHIIDIKDDDTDGGLVMREHPGVRFKRLAVIPKDSRCIPYLRKMRLLDNSWWAMLEYDGLRGWANARFTTIDKIGECDTAIINEKKHEL